MAQPGLDAIPEPPAATGVGERVSLATVLAYAPPVCALSSGLFFVQFFFLKFATDVLLMAPIAAGLLFALGRAWDAISDPIVGTWSDRTRTRLGRRRPWMLGAIPALAVTFAMVWTPPASLQGGALAAWLAVALFGFYTAYTAYAVPHQSLGAELTNDHHDRSRIFGTFNAFFTIGMMMAFGGMQYVTLASEPRDAAARMVLIGIGVAACVLLIPPTRLRERREYQGRGADKALGAMRDVLRNRHARLLLAVQFLQMMGTGVLGVLSPYHLQYVVKRPDLIGPLPAVFVVCTVISIPLWVRLSRRFGKRNVWIAGMIGTGLSFGGTFFVGENDIALISLLMVAAGASMGCGGTVGPSILADVIDFDEYESGQRKEGAYSAAWGFAIKSANALMILVASLVLQVSDFQPNVEQTEGTKLALRGIFAGMPLLGFTVGAALLRRFTLDAAEHARIRGELERRAARSLR